MKGWWRVLSKLFQTSQVSTCFNDFLQKFDKIVFLFTPDYDFNDCSQNGCVIKQPGRSCQVSTHPCFKQDSHTYAEHGKQKHLERCCSKCPLWFEPFLPSTKTTHPPKKASWCSMLEHTLLLYFWFTNLISHIGLHQTKEASSAWTTSAPATGPTFLTSQQETKIWIWAKYMYIHTTITIYIYIYVYCMYIEYIYILIILD